VHIDGGSETKSQVWGYTLHNALRINYNRLMVKTTSRNGRKDIIISCSIRGPTTVMNVAIFCDRAYCSGWSPDELRFLVRLIFDFEHGSDTFLRNVGSRRIIRRYIPEDGNI
jgi:hypothetical protein